MPMAISTAISAARSRRSRARRCSPTRRIGRRWCWSAAGRFFPARWPGKHAAGDAPILAVVPEDDYVGDSAACRDALTASGADIVSVPNATHAFDDPDPTGIGFEYNAEATAENRTRFTDFLEETLTR